MGSLSHFARDVYCVYVLGAGGRKDKPQPRFIEMESTVAACDRTGCTKAMQYITL